MFDIFQLLGNTIFMHNTYLIMISEVTVQLRLDGVVWRIIGDSPNLPNISAIWYTYVASYCVCCLYSQDY